MKHCRFTKSWRIQVAVVAEFHLGASCADCGRCDRGHRITALGRDDDGYEEEFSVSCSAAKPIVSPVQQIEGEGCSNLKVGKQIENSNLHPPGREAVQTLPFPVYA